MNHPRTSTEPEPFALEDMYRHPGALKTHDAPGPRKRVCIIGAGISGLTAAYELTDCDHSVVVLEASQRSGGRIRTARFADGSHGELGAMRIPANHHATLHYVEAFGLGTRPFINSNPAAKYCIRGTTVARGEWERLAERFALPPHERRDPLAVYEGLMQKAMAMLSTHEKRQLFHGNFAAGQVKAYDAQTLWQFLRRGLSSEAIQFLGHATGMIWYEQASFLEALVDYFGLFRIDSVQLVDGMDALPSAFAQHLGDTVRYDAHVTAVAVLDDGVNVTWDSQAETRTEQFDYAICAVPAPRAAAIEFTPSLPPPQLDALRRLTYASGAKTLLHCRTRPWEHLDGIYGGGSFTDLPIQQCWYPSDNARAVETELAIAFTGDDPGAVGGGYSRAPAAWTARSLERSYEPGVLTAAYMWEANAHRFAALSTEERTALVLSDIAKLHPEVLPEIEDVTHIVWDEEVGGGTYAFYAPGDYQRFHGLMRQPFPHQEPRVFFAGEHLAVSHAWIQGAVRTGWDAASYVATMGSGRETTLCPALADSEGAS